MQIPYLNLKNRLKIILTIANKQILIQPNNLKSIL